MTSLPAPPLSFGPSPSRSPFNSFSSEVVELPLLLPKDWAEQLIYLAGRRHQSVANLLRDLVGQAIDQQQTSEISSTKPSD